MNGWVCLLVCAQVIPNYSTREDYDRMFAVGATMYGQMTAGSYCFIGPQGIVHGTTVGVEWSAEGGVKGGRERTLW